MSVTPDWAIVGSLALALMGGGSAIVAENPVSANEDPSVWDDHVSLSVGFSWDPNAGSEVPSANLGVFSAAVAPGLEPPARVRELARGLLGSPNDVTLESESVDDLIADSGRTLLDGRGSFGSLYAFKTKHGDVCYVSESGAGGCVSGLQDGLSVTWVSEGSHSRAETHVFGVVVDSVKEVAVELSDGQTVDARVGSNGYHAALPGGIGPQALRALRVTRHDGSEVRVSLNP